MIIISIRLWGNHVNEAILAQVFNFPPAILHTSEYKNPTTSLL